MSTLAQILDGMADTIRGVISDVTDVDVQIEPRMVINPTPPTIDVWPGDPSEDPELAAFGDELGGEIITIRVRVSTADSYAGQDLLLALMDDEDELSIVNALADEPTLNGRGQVHIRGRTGYGMFPVPNGDPLLGCTFAAVVVKERS